MASKQLVKKALDLVREDFMGRPGVTGVGMGSKRGDEFYISVFVEEKGKFEPEHEIPKIIMVDGKEVETDIKEMTFVFQ